MTAHPIPCINYPTTLFCTQILAPFKSLRETKEFQRQIEVIAQRLDPFYLLIVSSDFIRIYYILFNSFFNEVQ